MNWEQTDGGRLTCCVSLATPHCNNLYWAFLSYLKERLTDKFAKIPHFTGAYLRLAIEHRLVIPDRQTQITLGYSNTAGEG